MAAGNARYIAAAIFIYGFVCFDAFWAFPDPYGWFTFSVAGKWHRQHKNLGNLSLTWIDKATVVKMRITRDGVELRPRAGLYYQYGTNKTDGIRGVNCTVEEIEPCYPFMEFEVVHVFWLATAGPFLPLVGSIVILGPKGAGGRFCYYFNCMLVFGLFYYVKQFIQEMEWYKAVFGPDFDASDRVISSLVGLLVAFDELELSQRDSGTSRVVTCLCLGVLCGKMYQSYFACLYFHTPLESFFGYLLGIGVVWYCRVRVKPTFVDVEDDSRGWGRKAKARLLEVEDCGMDAA
eukprot:TRINITY_DN113472_c0_g1_i1.p1 TRINITY_DN113472_c0_g1~~TRINITY_DN113472_c0_g1_i1.p1  ORF type:complete len:291 (-),score=46.09 TRINITY_DN113472_c0_g1_i1:62-934(-)